MPIKSEHHNNEAEEAAILENEARHLRFEAEYRKTENGETERRCPRCGAWAQADHVDTGSGMERRSPYYCRPCSWIDPITPAGWDGYFKNG